MNSNTIIRAFDAARALAFVGDLSMGQPTDHSLRTTWIARQLAVAEGFNAKDCDVVCEASLLRRSACIANATGFAELLGDDVAGREAMIAMRPGWADALSPAVNVAEESKSLSTIHCEVSLEVGRMLGLSSATQATLWHLLETFDGRGGPQGLAGDYIPPSVFVISLAGDLEVFTRVYGVKQALALISEKSGSAYPASLARSIATLIPQWLEALAQMSADEFESSILTTDMQNPVSPELIGDVVDLKLPWMTGFSRSVAQTAAACCKSLGLDRASQDRVYRAGLIHAIGNATIPNSILADPAKRSASAWEKVRLAPYWTLRAGRQIPALEKEAEIASYAHERLDGSGYFRGVGGNAIPLEASILGTALAWIELRSARPWRMALTAQQAIAQLMDEAKTGRLDSGIVEHVASMKRADGPTRRSRSSIRLSSRETEVLRRISLGASNKDVARDLELSPSTVRTHVESIFRKLECSTRAAATLKAFAMGLLPAEPTDRPPSACTV